MRVACAIHSIALRLCRCACRRVLTLICKSGCGGWRRVHADRRDGVGLAGPRPGVRRAGHLHQRLRPFPPVGGLGDTHVITDLRNTLALARSLASRHRVGDSSTPACKHSRTSTYAQRRSTMPCKRSLRPALSWHLATCQHPQLIKQHANAHAAPLVPLAYRTAIAIGRHCGQGLTGLGRRASTSGAAGVVGHSHGGARHGTRAGTSRHGSHRARRRG